MPPFFKALIFDLDGTLVDSSEVVRKVMEAWCLKHNISIQAVLDVCHGARTEDTVSMVAPHLCANSEAEEIERLENSFVDGIKPIAGAERFLASLPTDSWAIVTSSSLISAKHKLNTCGMDIPQVFITAESVSFGKPHPEPFLQAAKKLGIKPTGCLVFEDADNGVHSALAAGCRVIIIGEACKIEDENIVCRSLNFTDFHMSNEGELKLKGNIIATFTCNAEI